MSDSDLVDYALSVGYLTEMTIEEERSWFRAYVNALASDRDEEGVVTLSLVTTNTCNLACSYCFQSDSGMRDLPQRLMSIQQVKHSFEAVDKMIADGKRLSHIELFGGEPLLPSTRAVVEYAVLEAEQRGLVTRATSNGMFLHLYADLLGPSRIYDLQVSLDGSARFHDQRRVAPNPKPTFYRILENIELAVELGVDVDIRANIDRRNLDGMIELIELLDSRGLLDSPNAEFTYVNVWPDSSAADSSDTSIFLSRTDIDTHLAVNAPKHPAVRKVIQSVTPLAEYLRKIMNEPSLRFCGAGSNNLFVSPEALVYACDEHVGQPALAVASMSRSQVTTLPLWDVWKDRRVDKLKNCTDCSVSLAHGGGCAAKLDRSSLELYGNCGTFPADFDEQVRRLALLTY